MLSQGAHCGLFHWHLKCWEGERCSVIYSFSSLENKGRVKLVCCRLLILLVLKPALQDLGFKPFVFWAFINSAAHTRLQQQQDCSNTSDSREVGYMSLLRAEIILFSEISKHIIAVGNSWCNMFLLKRLSKRKTEKKCCRAGSTITTWISAESMVQQEVNEEWRPVIYSIYSSDFHTRYQRCSANNISHLPLQCRWI